MCPRCRRTLAALFNMPRSSGERHQQLLVDGVRASQVALATSQPRERLFRQQVVFVGGLKARHVGRKHQPLAGGEGRLRDGIGGSAPRVAPASRATG